MKTIEVITEDGTAITASLFTPAINIKAGVIINSATAVPRGYYRAFSEYLCERGFLVITYDYRGIGDSQKLPWRDASQTMQAWGEQDFNGVLNWGCEHYPTFKWHCIGHSVGGQLVGLAKDNYKLTSVYNVAAQSGNWRNWERSNRPKLILMWYVLTPVLTRLLGFLPGFLVGGQRLPKKVAQQWAQWCRHPDYMVDEKGLQLRPYFSSFTKPMKFIQIADDHDFAPLKAVQQLYQFYDQAHSSLEVLEPNLFGRKKVGHFGFFKKTSNQGFWQHVQSWLESC